MAARWRQPLTHRLDALHCGGQVQRVPVVWAAGCAKGEALGPPPLPARHRRHHLVHRGAGQALFQAPLVVYQHWHTRGVSQGAPLGARAHIHLR